MSGPSPETNIKTNEILILRVCSSVVALVVVTTIMVLIAAYWMDFGFFWFAFLAGVFGASVALLRRLRDETEFKTEAVQSWMPTLMPQLYGGLLAAITYFLFVSGILSGSEAGGFISTSLFPNFSSGEPNDGVLTVNDFLQSRPVALQDAGKLMVWCFLGGYSEGFVTGMLGRLEKHTSEE